MTFLFHTDLKNGRGWLNFSNTVDGLISAMFLIRALIVGGGAPGYEKNLVENKQSHGYHTSELSEWDKQSFNNRNMLCD